MSAPQSSAVSGSVAAARESDLHLRAIREVLRRPIDAEIAPGSLTGPQHSVMRILAATESLSLKALSRQVGLSHSTVSGIVDRLEKRGLVTRRPGEKDRRYTEIAVTPAVRDFIRETRPGLSVHPLLSALERATAAERSTVLEGLRILRRLLAESAEAPPNREKALQDSDEIRAAATTPEPSDGRS